MFTKTNQLMYRLLLFLFLFCNIYVVTAQKNQSNQVKFSEKTLQQNYVTLNVLSPLNPLLPRYRAGYFQRIATKWAASIDVGYGDKNISLKTDRQGTNYQLFEIRPEFYYTYKDIGTSHYISMELFYIKTSDTFQDETYVPENSNREFEYDQADFDRGKIGFHIKSGHIFRISDDLRLNLYYGIGIRQRKIQYSNVKNPQELDGNYVPGYSELFSVFEGLDFLKEEGTATGLNVSLGLKVMYHF